MKVFCKKCGSTKEFSDDHEFKKGDYYCVCGARWQCEMWDAFFHLTMTFAQGDKDDESI